MARLTLEQRCKIKIYRNTGSSIFEIADFIGKDKSVISREIKRNADQRSGVYKAALADKKAKNRHKTKHKKRNLTAEVEVNIFYYLIKDHRPDQIVRKANIDKVKTVSIERIYQYIWDDKRRRRTLSRYLRTKGKKYKKRGHLKDKRGLIVGRVRISQRPLIIEKKSRLCDLEIDLIKGKNHQGALLTMGKIDSKEGAEIEKKMIEPLQD